MNDYRQQLINNIQAFIDEKKNDPRGYVQGNVIAAYEGLEIIQGLNQLQACKVARKIAEGEKISGATVHPIDYTAFI